MKLDSSNHALVFRFHRPHFTLGITTSAPALAQQPLSELEENIRDIQPYLASNAADVQKILRGLTWLRFDVYFRSDSAELDYFNSQQIFDVVKMMRIYPMLYVTLSSRTDARGSKAYNKKLADRRLAVAYDIFTKVNKIDPKRIFTVNFGEANARYKADDKEGMFYDRKVEIHLLVYKE